MLSERTMRIFALIAVSFLAAGSPQIILAQRASTLSHHLPQTGPTLTTVPRLATPSTTSTSTLASTPTMTSAIRLSTPKVMVNRAAPESGVLTISVTNSYGAPLSLSYASNAPADGTPVPPPIGDPTPAVLTPGAATAIVYPTGWAGRISVGKVNTAQGSKIEGSTTGSNDVDVSYVDGYTVPITCSSAGLPVTGCNIELFRQGIACDGNLLDGGTTCQNPKQGQPYGPASPFFAACAGAAYTYPQDNAANIGGLDTTVTCCIGVSCPPPDRQGKASHDLAFSSSFAKSAKEKLLDRGLFPRVAGSPSLLPHLWLRYLRT